MRRPWINSDLRDALGGEVGGQVEEDGTWSCADCEAGDRERGPGLAGLALYRHRQAEHIGRGSDDA